MRRRRSGQHLADYGECLSDGGWLDNKSGVPWLTTVFRDASPLRKAPKRSAPKVGIESPILHSRGQSRWERSLAHAKDPYQGDCGTGPLLQKTEEIKREANCKLNQYCDAIIYSYLD